MRVDNWTIMSPYARLVFRGETSEMRDELSRVPGVKLKGGLWNVPLNAIEVVEGVRASYGAQTVAAAWGDEPKEPAAWPDVKEALLAGGEVKDWVLDGFTVPYQDEAVAFGWNLAGVHFWHPTGSGKTLTGLLCALSAEGPIVVVTRAAARLQYAREIERFLNLRAYVVRPATQTKGQIRVNGETWNEFRSRHKGQGYSTKAMGKLWKAHQAQYGIDPPKQLEDYVKEVAHRPIIVVGWESLTINLGRLMKLKPGAVIYDESHRGKGTKRWDPVSLPELSRDPEKAREEMAEQFAEAKSKDGFIKTTEGGRLMFIPVLNTAAAAARLARVTEKRICTTATPIKDRVRDLWAQLDLAEPNAWGNATTWLNRHADRKPGTYGGYDTTGSSNLNELNTRLTSIAHILAYEETHRHLPEKRRQSVYIAPEDQCRPATGSDWPKQLRDAKKRGANALLEVRLAQAASKKRRAVLGMVGDHVASGHKVVLFTGRKLDCEALGEDVRKHLKKIHKASTTVWQAHGEQSVKKRQGIVDDYMEHPGPCVLVGTGHSFGESLNIQDTDAVLFVMLPYTPGQLRQWEGRFSRHGQKRPVIIYYVIAEDTVDEHVASILIDKLPAVQEVAQDEELAEAKDVLAGFDPNETDDEFVDSILADLDF